ncbi:MAG: hypothetical protein QGH73_17895 [Rhodospirillales bacterium]|nr:hypothetical protein [Rhodospirillales bacterium]
MIGGGEFRLLLIAGAHTRRGIPENVPGQFIIHSLVLERDEKAPTATEIIAGVAPPDAVILFDIYGPRVPEGIFDLGIPVIYWTYDFDFHLPSQHDDLVRADLIMCAMSGEHFPMDRIYPGRVATYPAHDIYTDRAGFSASLEKREIDLVHTGNSFTPMMRGKSQFLFELAAIDGDDLDIRIYHGFMETEDYRAIMAQTRLSAIYERLIGGMQTRAMDAACAGGIILSPQGMGASSFLRLAGADIQELDLDTLPADAPGRIRNPAEDGFRNSGKNLQQIFPPSPEREIRFLKHCLFQIALLNQGTRFTGPETVAKPISTGKPAGDGEHTEACRTVIGLIHAFTAKPLDGGIRAELDALINTADEKFETSVPLNFNLGRYLWATSDKAAAIQKFRHVCQIYGSGLFDPARDDIRIHLMPVRSELTPYEAYFNSLARDLAFGNDDAPEARSIIAATAKCYIGLDYLQENRLDAGIEALTQALDLCPVHFPAARLCAKALYAADRPAEIILDAVYTATALYAPYLTEFLSIALRCHEKLDDADGALSIVKSWCYFASRVQWMNPGEHPIPGNTWQAIEPYLGQLPPGLAQKITDLRDERAHEEED